MLSLCGEIHLVLPRNEAMAASTTTRWPLPVGGQLVGYAIELHPAPGTSGA
jgi:hypothetical protein